MQRFHTPSSRVRITDSLPNYYMYSKPINAKAKNNGYLCFYDKDHPLATTDGRVPLHRHLASVYIAKRWLNSTEQVHHIDGNKENNDISNLEILSVTEHFYRHHTKLETLTATCSTCSKIFRYTNRTGVGMFCSLECNKQIKNRDITKEILDGLIPKHTWVELGKMFNYSDVGIKKRAKALGCTIPIRRSISATKT